MNGYRTIAHESKIEIVIKKSRFIGYAFLVSSAEEANEKLAALRKRHWDASNHCSAYVLGADQQLQKYSDDGEPSGTAGVPVLDVLLKENLVNVCVVATRYFGGTLLGAGGLVRAYSHTSKIAIEAANIVTMAECGIYRCDIDYSFYDRLVVLLNEVGANIEGSDFSDKVKVIFTVKEKYAKILAERLTDVSNGKYRIRRLGRKFDKIG